VSGAIGLRAPSRLRPIFEGFWAALEGLAADPSWVEDHKEELARFRRELEIDVVAPGIAEALITTAAGLIVAIPALAMHRYLRGRVAEIVVEMEVATITLINTLYGAQMPTGPAPVRRRAPKAAPAVAS